LERGDIQRVTPQLFFHYCPPNQANAWEMPLVFFHWRKIGAHSFKNFGRHAD
jgi:hypothetical protein